ncbi:FAD-dependent thymidylate synthase [bacterium]|nr:FAD-dependent thymidylate synthase [bacterium]
MSDSLPLKVTLAGFNVDHDTLTQLEAAAYEGGEAPPREAITPETISAAYARISRNPAEVGEIRAKARFEVEKARRSNSNIIFGLGHSSVAEHAAFNIDVVGISRLAVEAVERHRLASFTEKSQRYIKLDGDIVVPPEIVDAGFEEEFHALIRRQNEGYFALYPKLLDYFIPILTDEGSDRAEKDAKSRAAEDARYVVSLATQAQFGMTVNARTIEGMLRDGFAHPLVEVKAYAEQLSIVLHGIAPSLIKYTDATQYEIDQFERQCYWPSAPSGYSDTVTLLEHDPEGDTQVLTALLINSKGSSWAQARETVERLDSEERIMLVHELLRNAQQWDPPPREFELTKFTYEIILSAAGYGQLKRHRMATQIVGPYDPSLGWTVPKSVEAAGGKPLFNEIMEVSIELAEKIAKVCPQAAAYALTNAHRRRVIFQANGRELYHISRLREDLHAQWDIRQLAGQMLVQAREVAPTLLAMAVGKHDFSKKRDEVYGAAASTSEA